MAAPDRDARRAPRMNAAERRAQLARAAASRFHLLGYHQVSLSDVAADVGLTGPAVYRHFPSKQALLAGAAENSLDRVEDALERHLDDSLPRLMSALTCSALERPDVWPLLQREIRVLSPELREPLQQRMRAMSDRLARRLRRDRADLTDRDARVLVIGALGVLAVPSTSHTSLAPAALHGLIETCSLACLDATLGAGDSTPRTATMEAGERTRREHIVDTAVELFFEHGFSGVSLDDIGAAVGMAGPSLLHHFTTKADILTAAFDRASARLAAEQRARRSGDSSVDLPALVARYVEFCIDNRALLGLYVTEFLHLPDDARDRTTTTIRTELRDWTRSLLAHALDLDEPSARMRVRAALSVVNDLTRLGAGSRTTATPHEVTAVTLAVLRAS